MNAYRARSSLSRASGAGGGRARGTGTSEHRAASGQMHVDAPARPHKTGRGPGRPGLSRRGALTPFVDSPHVASMVRCPHLALPATLTSRLERTRFRSAYQQTVRCHIVRSFLHDPHSFEAPRGRLPTMAASSVCSLKMPPASKCTRAPLSRCASLPPSGARRLRSPPALASSL